MFRHRRPAQFVLIALLVFGLASLPGSGQAEPADGSASNGGQGITTDEVRFRTEVNLPADKGYLHDLHRQEKAGRAGLNRKYGVLLTDVESERLNQRNAQATANADAAKAFFGDETNPLLGGMYFDHQAEELVVLVTGEVERVSAELRSRVPQSNKLRVTAAGHSLETLRNIGKRIAGDMAELERLGVTVTGIGSHERTNTVEVRAEHLTTVAQAVFAERYPGLPLSLVEAPRPTTNGRFGQNAPPLRGAQYIINSGGYQCSSGLVARAPGAIGNRYFVVTAGHCGTAVWSQLAYAMGQSEFNMYYSGSLADAMRIPVSIADMSREIYLREGNYQIIRYTQSFGGDYIGQLVCASGYQTEITCGTILQRDTTVPYTGTTLYNMRRASYTTTPGDSGGSVFLDDLAMGIHSGSVTYSNGTKEGLYSHVPEVMAVLGVSTATSCEGGLTPYCR